MYAGQMHALPSPAKARDRASAGQRADVIAGAKPSLAQDKQAIATSRTI